MKGWRLVLLCAALTAGTALMVPVVGFVAGVVIGFNDARAAKPVKRITRIQVCYGPDDPACRRTRSPAGLHAATGASE
jgi:hypothetical protein